MEETTGARLDLILKRLPAAMACAAFALAASLDWELPWLGDLAAGVARLGAAVARRPGRRRRSTGSCRGSATLLGPFPGEAETAWPGS
jgi:hypothetical protein